MDKRIIDWLSDHKDGSFMLCQAHRAGVWQWFCKMTTKHFTGLRYDGDPQSAIDHVFKQWDAHLAKREEAA